MARQIDERIVQMTFNNQEFEQRAKATISTLGNLKKAIDFTGLTNGFAELGNSANKINFNPLLGSINAIGNQFSIWEQLAIGALRRVGDQATQTGERLVRSLTIDQLSQGWGKYNDLNSSVQTLVNSTGKSVSEIDGYLKRLMWYSDETSFGFTDMTKALGTMVSSGGEIDTLIPMLMGVGNAVAYAGKGASEFTRVIYNLNQSYSSGFLNTQDWRSIELAGVDSKVLKEQLLGVAVSLGKIDKGQATISNFRNLLSDKVFTREVMEKAFGNFAQMTLEAEKLVSEGKFETAAEAMDSLSGKYEEFAERAFRSAQEAKSFSEAIEATKDAVSSGWMQSFQLIFGDYEEAKSLWTDVVNDMWEVFASGASNRNKILQDWKNLWNLSNTLNKNLEGHGKLSIDFWDDDSSKQAYDQIKRIHSLNEEMEKSLFGEDYKESLTQVQALWHAISAVIMEVKTAISDIWSGVFESTSAESIFLFIEKIRQNILEIAVQIKSVNDGVAESGSAFTSVYNFVQSILKIIKGIFNIGKKIWSDLIDPIIQQFKPILSDILGIFSDIGTVLSNADILSNMSPLESILKGLLDILSPIIGLIGNVVKGIREFTSSLANPTVEEGAEKLDFFSKVLQSIGNILNWIAGIFKGTINVFEGIGKVLGTVIDKIKGVAGEFLSSHGTDIAGLAEGGFLGVLALAITKIVGKIKKIKLDDIINSIKNVFSGEGGGGIFSKIKDTLDKVTEALNNFTQSLKIKMLKEIANTLLKLAAALLIVSLVDSDKIVTSLGAIAGMLFEVISVMAILGGMNTGNLNTSVKSLSKIASSILVLSFAFKIFASVDPEQVGTALIGLGGSLAIVLAFIALLHKSTKGLRDVKLATIGATLKAVGLGLIEIAIALKIAAGVNPDQLGTALLGLGGALGAVFLFMLGLSKIGGNSMASGLIGSKAIMAIGLALIELAVALKIMSTIKFEEMGVALLGILGSLGMLFAFMAGVGSIVGAGNFAIMSVSLIALSGALILMAGAFRILSKLTLGQIGKGILAIAGGLGSLALIAIPLGALSPVMLLAAAAIGLFGKDLLTVSEGIVAFASTYMLLQTIGDDISGSLLNILTQFSAAVIQIIPGLFLGIGQAILNLGDELVSLGLQFIEIIVKVMQEGIPRIVETSLELITTILTLLRDNIGEITVLGGEILLGFLQGVRDTLPQVTLVVLEIIANFITALGEGIPLVIDALIVAVIDIINGLAESIRSNAADLGEAIGNFWSALIEAIITGFSSGVASFGEHLLDFGTGIWGGIKQLFGGEESNEEANEVGKDLVTNVDTGLKENREIVYKSAKETGTETAKKMDAKDEATTSGKNTLDGLLTGLTDGEFLEKIRLAGKNAGEVFMNAYNSEVEVASPSKKMIRSGEFTVMGLIRGLSDVSGVEDAGSKLGQAVLNAVSSATEMANDVLDAGLNPIISPVLDMSNIQSGANAISNMLDTDASYNAALAVSNANDRSLGIQNGGYVNPTFNIDFTVNNAGRDLDSSDISRFTNQIADELNVKFGKLLWR